MFVSERGAPLTLIGFSRMVERAAATAKLNIKAHAHMLRHACGYAAAQNVNKYGHFFGTSAHISPVGLGWYRIRREQRKKRDGRAPVWTAMQDFVFRVVFVGLMLLWWVVVKAANRAFGIPGCLALGAFCIFVGWMIDLHDARVLRQQEERKRAVVKRKDKLGGIYHEPPYTKAEEFEFYRRVNAGPLTVYWGSKPGSKLPAATKKENKNGDEVQ
ncbi:MAG TPA: hypothetical protein VGJ20_21050 [Xanthobacteraceae bacterium]